MSHRFAAASAAILLCTAGDALAHHSYGEFDSAAVVEIDGKLRSATWVNPHASLAVEVTDAAGKTVVWDIETLPRNYFTRTGIPLDSFVVGGSVKVAGWPSKRKANRMYGTNLLSSGGHEMVWRSEPRWSKNVYGYGTEEGAKVATSSIFRVWASVYGPARAQTLAVLSAPDAPLTDAARRAVEAFDPINDTTTPGCAPKGMPQIMFIPAPMEVIDRGDTIAMHIEEYDSVREIHMAASAERPGGAKTRLGHSRGRWDGKTLVVETDDVETPYLSGSGLPLGAGASFVERFTPSDDGSRLDYRIEITAPEVLTRTATVERSWVFRPGERVLPFECVE